MKNFEVATFPGPDELAQAAASAWLAEVGAAQRAGKSHNVAVSGGRITQKFFASVVDQMKTRRISFEHVHFFWADERCVPPTDPESNFRMAQQLLFAPLKICPDQVHRLHGEIAPESAAQAAEAEICQVTPVNETGQPVLDLIFLGLGEDGHVASLFPAEPEAISAKPAAYRAVFNSPKPPPERITLGFQAIAAARQVWMLASGDGKEAALRKSLSIEGGTPFGRVLRLRAQTKILTDISVK